MRWTDDANDKIHAAAVRMLYRTSMSDDHIKNWDNYWQGRSSQATGNALVEVGIEDNHALNDFWTDALRDRSRSAAIIDLACGAGSVLKHASTLGFNDLTGVDVSRRALDVMKENVPNAVTMCATVDGVDVGEKSYDLAVSQFGIEYAGSRNQVHQALSKMSSMLKPGGEIMCIAHAKGSLIYKGCEASLAQAKLIEESGFIDLAAQVLQGSDPTSYLQSKAEVSQKVVQLGQAAEPILGWLRKADLDRDEFAKFTHYVLESTHKLLSNQQAYSRAESLAWFSGIKSELAAYKGRMSSMTEAALDQDELQSLIADVETNDPSINFQPTEPFLFHDGAEQAAWTLRATKL